MLLTIVLSIYMFLTAYIVVVAKKTIDEQKRLISIYEKKLSIVPTSKPFKPRSWWIIGPYMPNPDKYYQRYDSTGLQDEIELR